MPIDSSDPRYRLGIPSMDQTHLEFIDLANQLEHCTAAAFADGFQQLLTHTQQHFAAEQNLMESSRFPALREHQEEHQRVLGDLHRLAERVRQGSPMLARAFVRQQLPDWFHLHAATMDSALAGHLKQQAS